MNNLIKYFDDNNIPYKYNDNISEYLNKEMIKKITKKCTKNIKKLFKILLIDINDDNTKDTPKRISKMYVNEILKGRYKKPPKVSSFPIINNCYSNGNNILLIKFSLNSLCCHHFLPIKLNVKIGIILNDNNVLGLSKYYRICDYISSKPTLQEKIIINIKEEIIKHTQNENIAIYIDGIHDCCNIRGIKQDNYNSINYLFSGLFDSDINCKNNFINLIKN